MANYTMPNITDALDYFEYGNSITGGLFGIVLLFVIWIIVFMFIRDEDVIYNSAIASFVCIPISVLLWMLNLVHADTPLFLIILTGVLTIAAKRKRTVYV